MSVQTIARQPVSTTFNGRAVNIQPVTTIQTLRIIGIINRMKSAMHLTPEDMKSIRLSTAGILELFGRVLEGVSADIDTNMEQDEDGNPKLKGLPLTVFNEVAATCVYTTGQKMTAMDVALAPIDDTIALLGEIMKAEAETSLGKRILATYGRIAGIARGMMAVLESETTVGGQANGGQTSSSTQSPENTDGQTITSSASQSSEP